MNDTLLTNALRRDSRIVAAALVLTAALAWAYLWRLAANMDVSGMDMNAAEMARMMAPAYSPWSAADAALTFAMWAVMMVGMMTPGVAPVVLLYARVAARSAQSGRPFASAGWFMGGYVLAWTGFSVAATAAQWLLDKRLVLDPMMASASAAFNGIVLLAAGAYQWTPLKQACLHQCRAPLSFVQRHGGFRPGALPSLRLGSLHGLYCLGCCWALMALLFVGGVMNLLWIAALTIAVLLEKLIPVKGIPRLTGTGFIIAGAYWLATTLGR